ncbi:SsrA-binding protein SmpB [Acidimicrobiia bacterium EGI L10123]|uniref:SsrA-binding protein SmpB n=1 Tax=Salinilacustrithrix flava TaxID=2957203 RepID=UPI000E8427DE|nr:SsrA-binding protein SmpB [Acidimicrobiia bacterium EGI L10123]HAS13186.1 SsrA-binding protein [Acidimicrobiaceae bacterium]
MPAADTTLIAANRRARRNYDITETLEAGIVLHGSEVKSLREATVQIADGYVRFEGNEAWLQGVHIAPYLFSQDHSGHDPDRHRKLLLHRRELDRLRTMVDLERVSIVPLSLYFKDGKAKVELGVGKGRKLHDKRAVEAERDADREIQRALAHRGRD